MFFFYLCFFLFAIFRLPGSINEHFAPDRLHDVIALNFSTENSILLAVFLMIGVYQLGISALLLQAEAMQALPARFFAVTGFFCGFYVSGLYQALRRRVTNIRRSQLKTYQRVMESRFFGFLVLVAAVMVYIIGAGAFGRLHGSFVEELAHVADLAKTDRLVSVVFVDIAVTFLAIVDPLSEDMQRRGWSFSGDHLVGSVATLLAVVFVPGVGLGAYLTLRPRLPEQTTKTE